MYFLRWPSIGSIWFLMSCGATTPGSTNGAFISPDLSGQISHDLVETQSASIDETVSIVSGRREDEGLRAYAGIIPNQPVQEPLLGNATFSGPYAVAFIEDILIEDGFVTGRNSILEGTITLQADLSDMTLSGSDGLFSVQAQILNNAQINGDVQVFGVPGSLEGEIGEDRAFGAFHGSDPTHLMSGGFVTNRVP
jgi:hypothetical protein